MTIIINYYHYTTLLNIIVSVCFPALRVLQEFLWSLEEFLRTFKEIWRFLTNFSRISGRGNIKLSYCIIRNCVILCNYNWYIGTLCILWHKHSLSLRNIAEFLPPLASRTQCCLVTWNCNSYIVTLMTTSGCRWADVWSCGRIFDLITLDTQTWGLSSRSQRPQPH